MPVKVRTRVDGGARSSRPGSARAGLHAFAQSVANRLPLRDGARTLVAQVSADLEALVCYRPLAPAGRSRRRKRSEPDSFPEAPAADHNRPEGRGELALALRVPLRLAVASRSGDATVSIVPAREETLNRQRGTAGPLCEYFDATEGEGAACPTEGWTIECKDSLSAEGLFAKLQLAGCIMRGLLHRYELEGYEAKGGFGAIFAATDRLTGAQAAVKFFVGNPNSTIVHPLLESGILRRQRHPGIVEFQGLFEIIETDLMDELGLHDREHIYALVTEFLPGGDLLRYMQVSGRLEEESAKGMMRQILLAVAHLHKGRIVHRDIKMDNIVLSGGAPKLIDFGLAASETDTEAMLLGSGSPGFAAPESHRHLQSCKSDCFSCGVVMFMLLTGKPPFPGRTAMGVFKRNMDCDVDLEPLVGVSPLAHDLIIGLMQRRPGDRLSAAHALRHPWFHGSKHRTAPPAPRVAPPVLESSTDSDDSSRSGEEDLHDDEPDSQPQSPSCSQPLSPRRSPRRLSPAFRRKSAVAALRDRVASARHRSPDRSTEDAAMEIPPAPVW